VLQPKQHIWNDNLAAAITQAAQQLSKARTPAERCGADHVVHILVQCCSVLHDCMPSSANELLNLLIAAGCRICCCYGSCECLQYGCSTGAGLLVAPLSPVGLLAVRAAVPARIKGQNYR
jgi:hypothetical protein